MDCAIIHDNITEWYYLNNYQICYSVHYNMINMLGYIHVAQHAYPVICIPLHVCSLQGEYQTVIIGHIIMYYNNVYNTICWGYIMQLTVKV